MTNHAEADGLVVAAAVIDGAAVLAAQRSYPPDLAGYWEFPGGKVEEGETAEEALRRECREELGVDVAVGDQIGTDVPLAQLGQHLRLYRCRALAEPGIADGRAHSAFRWLRADQFGEVPWLVTNRQLLPSVAHLIVASA